MLIAVKNWFQVQTLAKVVNIIKIDLSQLFEYMFVAG